MNPILLEHPGVFVTGTDTEIGKTYVSALILKYLAEQGRRVVGMKPIASGFCEVDGQMTNVDVLSLRQESNVLVPLERTNRYAFESAVAPHIAAQQSQQKIEFSDIVDDLTYCKNIADHVIVEGVGGWCVPLNGHQQTHQDISGLAQWLELPVVLVVGIRLGCINHARLTAQAMMSNGVSVLGWVANNIYVESDVTRENIKNIRELLPIPLLFEVPFET